MANKTVLFRARVPERRLKRAEKVLSRLGLKPGDAFNALLAQIDLRQGIPFPLDAREGRLLTAPEQAAEWTQAFGAY